MSLTKSEQQQLLKLARQSINHALEGRATTVPSEKLLPALMQDGHGAFVTLYLNGRLRGCIGLLESNLSLAETVEAMASAAAFNDPRFKPLTAEEFSLVKIELSIVMPKQKIENINQIKLGRDGIVISGRGRQGVFLPQVASETGWDLETYLDNCCEQKAGLPPKAWQQADVTVFVFRTQLIKEIHNTIQ